MAIAAATSENDSTCVGGMGHRHQDLENGRVGGKSKTLPIEMIPNEHPNTRSPNNVPIPDITFGENTSKSSSVVFCRICHEGENSGERLISPCRCRGSVGLVHRTCIEKWLTMVNIDSCEICKQKYSVMRHPRPFSRWLCEPVVGDDRGNLVGDGVCFILLTPLAVISAYLCASGAAFYFKVSLCQ